MRSTAKPTRRQPPEEGQRPAFYLTLHQRTRVADSRPGDVWRVDYPAGVARRLRDGHEEAPSLGAIARAVLEGRATYTHRPPLQVEG
jgi:hypothetical protein